MKIQITEHKSKGTLNAGRLNTVRVFVNHDYHYGYFVDEAKLFNLLSPAQQAAYLEEDDVTLDVSVQVAQTIVDMGATPYAKPTLQA